MRLRVCAYVCVYIRRWADFGRTGVSSNVYRGFVRPWVVWTVGQLSWRAFSCVLAGVEVVEDG